MMHPKHIRISDYNYLLPDDRIAKYPKAKRDESKLLIYNKGRISEDIFFNLPNHIPPGRLMVMNNTKVIRARLHFHKATGAHIEVFCLEPHTPHDYQINFATRGSVSWTCLLGNLKKWKEGILEQEVIVGEKKLFLRAERIGVSGTGHEIRFSWNDDDASFSEILEAVGEMPIPPYLNRATEASDLQTYQTVYSKIKGSVAAPTAGLHFTKDVLEKLQDDAGVETAEITLHVGAGTFKPVKSEEIGEHQMHEEWFAVKREVIEQLIAHGGKCIAVGTTSVRTLESLYYIGKMLQNSNTEEVQNLHVPQWIAYETDEPNAHPTLSTMEALQAILAYLDRHQLPVLHASTQIIIAPGYKYKLVEAIVTNFHQPQSTLLLLVSAFVGDDWRKIYDYALNHNFRFLSYGDSSLLIP